MASHLELKCVEEILKWTVADKSRLRDFLNKKGHPAQEWLDQMQQLVDYPHLSPVLRPAIFTVMLRLSKSSGLHPTCLSIQNVKKIGEYPIAAGAFGDVWKGTVGDSSELVCLKVVKVYLNSDLEKLSTEYIREAILWRQMKHPNVLPFLGIYRLDHTQQLCLISPWMEKGNLVQFMKATKREDIDHYTLVYDVTSGVAYLHSKKIVHGDLKGVNILITDSLRACIGDFGLSRVADTQFRITASTTRPVGTARWLAPELLLHGGGPSKESDMYSYACVCYEIFTGLQPFSELVNEMAVAFNVAQGKRPSRPKGAPELSDTMWALMVACWDATPSSRPTACHVLENVAKMPLRVSTPASHWSESLSIQIRENVEYHSTEPPQKADQTFPDSHEPLSIIETNQMASSEPALLSSQPSAETSDGIDQLVVYLMGTDVDDWTMVSYICEHASISQSGAENSATALRRELKYGTSRSQLLATKLWAIMLHNASDLFTTATTSQKFLDAIEDVLENESTNQVVRDRVLEVVGSAAYRSVNGAPFRRLWRRVKPPSAPDEGIPLDDDHPFNIKDIRETHYPTQNVKSYDPPIIPAEKTAVVICKARALFAYIGSHEDPYELSFAKDETLEILGNAGTWWHARKPDGTIGSEILSVASVLVLGDNQNSSETQENESSQTPVDYAKALYYYKASSHDPSEVSFVKDEILDVLDKAEKWWRVRKVDGTIGIAPSDYLALLDDIQRDRSTIQAANNLESPPSAAMPDAPKPSSNYPQYRNTPRKGDSTHHSAYTQGHTNQIRKTNMKTLGDKLPKFEVSYFLESVVPDVPEDKADEVFQQLIYNGTIVYNATTEEHRWCWYDVDPSEMDGSENKVYKHLDDISEAVVDVAKEVWKVNEEEEQTVRFTCKPNHASLSDTQNSGFMTDGDQELIKNDNPD
ncbi:hypothetical protein PQX77_012208, partial [Marasmius sp. AFHP31]